MCGIYGSTILYDDSIIKKKLAAMRFRGPDNQSYKYYPITNGGKLALGHVRLSILDLDARSNQPFDYNTNISIVFNGEVYNYKELTSQYLKETHLRTTSDTEVICALYEKMGRKCLDLLNGMFAFVIYDRSKQELFGARDRLGKKPFYYRQDNNGFEFASQAEPIHIDNKFTIDDKARAFYLLNGYIPDPYCIWKEIKKLRAGQYFVYSLTNKNLTISTYWDIFSNSCNFSKPKSYLEAKDTIKDLLDDSVRIRLRSDVPIGMFLSGGIDSSLTAALIAKKNKNIEAFTIGFDDGKYDETNHSKSVADYLGIPIHMEKCEGNDMIEAFENYSIYYDEPFADFSSIPTSFLAKVARKNVKVAIGGDGGDELFYGYHTYQDLKKTELFYKLFPFVIRKSLYSVIHPILGHNLYKLRTRDMKEQFICRGSYGEFYDAAKFDPIILANDLPDIKYIKEHRGVLSYSDYDMKHYMNSCINTKTDRATMRHGLELRSPLMDYRIAEYSRLLPYEYLMSPQYGGKTILKDILFELVPRQLLERPKMGFAAPVGNWFKGTLRNKFIDVVNLNAIKNNIPELDAEKIIQYRDDFLNCRSILSETAFFKVYTYLQWIASSNNY